MQCEIWQEAISATLDGEDPGVEPGLIDAHVSHCQQCATFAALAARIRAPRPHPVPGMPDLPDRVVHAARVSDRRSAWGIVRLLLGACAIMIVIASLPELLFVGHEPGAHEARHLGAFTVAYAVALMVVVVRPARARAMLPVAMVLGLALVITGVADIIGGNAPLIGETAHLPELCSVLLLWLLASSIGRDRNTSSIGGHQPPILHVVERLDDTA